MNLSMNWLDFLGHLILFLRRCWCYFFVLQWWVVDCCCIGPFLVLNHIALHQFMIEFHCEHLVPSISLWFVIAFSCSWAYLWICRLPWLPWTMSLLIHYFDGVRFPPRYSIAVGNYDLSFSLWNLLFHLNQNLHPPSINCTIVRFQLSHHKYLRTRRIALNLYDAVSLLCSWMFFFSKTQQAPPANHLHPLWACW